MKQILMFLIILILFTYTKTLMPQIFGKNKKIKFSRFFKSSNYTFFKHCPYGYYYSNKTKRCRPRPNFSNSTNIPLWLNKNETNCTKEKFLSCYRFMNKTKCYCKNKIINIPRNDTREIECKPDSVHICTSSLNYTRCYCQQYYIPVIRSVTYSCSKGYTFTCFNSRYGERCYCKKDESNLILNNTNE